MRIITFAAIYVASYELEMKIFELSSQAGIRELDHIRHHLDLGRDTYADELVCNEMIEEICQGLIGFRQILREYQVVHHTAFATSALREAKNRVHVLDQIWIRTGFEIDVFSNPQQRYLSYKAIAARESDFNTIIQKGTAIVDMGGGSIQISLFDKDSLISTQNIRWGFIRLREALANLEFVTTDLGQMVYELIDEEIRNYKKLYLKDRKIEHIIAVCDYVSCLLPLLDHEQDKTYITRDEFLELYERLVHKMPGEIAELVQMPYENAAYVLPTLVVYKKFIEVTGAELIWAPGTTLGDGAAYDYAEKKKIIRSSHNFENDILAFARNIGKRYMCNKNHINQMMDLANMVFDAMKKIHGLGKRERLLLQICVLLHDCGKYISLKNASICSYNIIMNTEIIGLNKIERIIIANAVKFISEEFCYYDEMEDRISQEEFLLISKLTAILRLVHVLDISHRQKFREARAAVRNKCLIITIQTLKDISLEATMLQEEADFFEEIFTVRPEIKHKKYL